MCLVLVAWQVHSQVPCLIAANRDEFHGRPTAPARWWADDSQVLAGRDLQAGGTWLGITRTGRFAALTNFRDPEQRRTNAPSRGALVTSILQSTDSTAQILAHLGSIGAHYNGFNVIFSDGQQLGIYESIRDAGRELGPGLYGLSNHLLDTPWPKVSIAKNRLAAALSNLTDSKPVLALLRDEQPAADGGLPNTGVSLEWERLLSSAFVRAADYGTRCSTIIRVDRRGSSCFDEWSWDSAGTQSGRVTLQFERER